MVFINGLNGTIVTSFILNIQKLLFGFERNPLQEDCSNPPPAVSSEVVLDKAVR